jgi:arylsulfatase A-like enzyme
MDTHSPYRPPRPYDGMHTSQKPVWLYRMIQYRNRIHNKYDKAGWDSFLKSQYKGEINYLDQHLGRLFDALKEQGLFDSSLIIITSDHGDLFGKNKQYEHHQASMYEGIAKVPLLIKYPFSRKEGRSGQMINLTDLFPTILSICEIPYPPNISGKAFGDADTSIVGEFGGKFKVIYHKGYKLLNMGPESELYDIQNDPKETDNTIQKYPDVVRTMRVRLENWQKGRKDLNKTKNEKPPHKINPDVIENLKALGYIQ